MAMHQQGAAVGGPHGGRYRSLAGALRGGVGGCAIYLLFLLLIGLPLALVLVQAVMPGLFNLASANLAIDLTPLRRTFATPQVVLSIFHSLELAGGVAVLATALGGGFAFMVQRCDIPMRRVIATVPWLVFLTPSYLKALAWVLLMSPGGYLAQLGLLPAGLDRAFFGLGGLVFVHTLSLFPLATFVIGGALAGLGSEFEDAARLSGAPPLRVWLRINGPLLAPAIALSAIAIFAEVLSDFGLASTIARVSNFGVLTYGIFAAASDYPVDFPLAGAQALVLLLLVVIVVFADRILRRQKSLRLISGRSRPASMHELGPWKWLLLAVAGLIAVFALYGPLAAIVTRAASLTLGNGLALSNLTPANFIAALSLGTAANRALLSSLVYAGLTAFVTCSVALVLAIRLDLGGATTRAAIVGLSLGAVAIPGIVLGFGYILLWNRLPIFRDWPFPHYGDPSLLVTGYIATALPYCLIIIMSAVGQLAPSLGDAARLQGVGALHRVLRITLPLVLPSVTTAFLFTFIRTIFELPMSQMLIPLSGPAAPSLIVNLFGHDQDGLGSALSLMAMLAAGVVATLVWLAAQQFPGQRTALPKLGREAVTGELAASPP